MSTLKFVETHNLVAYLNKPTESEGLELIVDFLSAHRIRKPNRKNTHVPQPSGFTEHIADEAVHKERGDRLVRAATTASSLEAEQDSGAKKPWGIQLLKLGLKMCLNFPMIHCSQESRVLALEKTKTTQALEITCLQRRVKKLETEQRSRTHKLKRLYKVGLTARVDSSKNEPNLGEDASKHGRIKAIDADEDTTLVNDQDDVDDAKIFNVDDLHGEEVFVEKEDVDNEVNDEVHKVVEVVKDTITTKAIIKTEEVTLAKALVEFKASKPNVKGVFIQEPSEPITTTTTTIFLKKSQDKGKGIMVEETMKPKKKD
nr:hypothetical protein [Tanacetum cinerariifolium]